VNRDPVSWPDAATELSVPEWMLERWTKHFGGEQARKVAEAALSQPVAYARIAGEARLQAEATGSQRLHDISSQAIVPLLDLQPGSSYLDLCAAPGNKTLQALETPLGLAIACDISFARICQIPPVCHRVVLDATQPLPFGRTFDRIFVDAPCSGTGTLARNPEIKWRVKSQDFERFGENQLRIVQQGVRWLAPGGILVYATCSLESEENEAVVRKLLDSHASLRCEREMWRLPGRDEGDGFYAAVLKSA
jgi:16S rRNA (cytosine967-C5)-methyltransferase